MNDLRTRLQGLWLPLVTPFRDGVLDERSLRRLLRYYTSRPVDGLILGATSGEGLTLSLSLNSSGSSNWSTMSLRTRAVHWRSASALPARARQ
jgi:hypothetical protein